MNLVYKPIYLILLSEMKIFKDIFSGDELLSDALEIEEVENSIYKVTSKMVNEDDAGNVDIGCGNAFGSGDAEDDGGAPDVGGVKVNNIISGFNLEEFGGSKKDVAAKLKEKMNAVKAYLKENGKEDRAKEWEQDGVVGKFLKACFGKFDECVFYMGRSYGLDDPVESMLVVSYWVNDSDSGETFFFFKDALKESKV